jgi:hypothetical protein
MILSASTPAVSVEVTKPARCGCPEKNLRIDTGDRHLTFDDARDVPIEKAMFERRAEAVYGAE